MSRGSLFLAVLLSIASAHADVDDPNYRKEDRFHEIYKKFNEEPVSEEVWGRAYGATQPREYVVVKTDTLWDISKVLFADPVFWPKIWSFNTDDITNPHEISPGQRIQFFPGTIDAPPAVVVVEFEGVALPSKQKMTPVAKIPASLPAYTIEVPKFDLPKIIRPDLSALTTIPPLPLPVEIVNEKPDRKGRLVEIEEGARLADMGRELYVSLNEDAQPGRYTIIKNIERNKYGYIVQYRAEIEVLEKINDSENVYKARVTKMLDSVEVGDYLILGTIPEVDISEKQKSRTAPFVRIVGGFRSPTDLLFSPYSIVFLDGGQQEGLHEGDVLSVFQEPRTRLSGTKQKKSYREIGTLKVIRLQDNLATGYILTSKTEIREGDLAGSDSTNSGSNSSSDSDELSLD